MPGFILYFLSDNKYNAYVLIDNACRWHR